MMNNLPSDKTSVFIMRDGSKIFLTDMEAEAIKSALKRGDKFLDIGTSFISALEFSKIISGVDYVEIEKIKRGDYKCLTCNNWIPKGKSCALCVA